MNTRHLRSFLRVAETKSISRAAVSLGIAQPSLSQHILRLEDEVGQQLLKRTARGITLTEAGAIFRTHARQILRSVEQGIDDVRQAAARIGVELTVRLEVDAIALIPALVAKGHGYSILPGSSLPDAAAHQIATARIGRGTLRRSLCLARNNAVLVTSASMRCEQLTLRVLERLIDKGVWNAQKAAPGGLAPQARQRPVVPMSQGGE